MLDICKSNYFTLKILCKNGTAVIWEKYESTDLDAYEKELREKEVEGIINLKDHQIQTLQSKIKEMEQQLREASSKVDVSEKTVKDIALKAIVSAGKTQFVEREKVKE